MVNVSNPVNWTIKNIAEEAKDYALERSKEAQIPVGIWVEKLILADKEGRPMPAPGAVAQVNLRDLAEVMRASADIMAASGKPIPKRAVSNAYSLLTHELRNRRQELPQQPARRRDHAAASVISGSGAGSEMPNSAWRGNTPAIAKIES